MRKKQDEMEAVELAPVEAKEPEKHVVFIPSNLVAYQSVTKDKKTCKFLEGSVNGRKFKVLCDSQQEVSEDVFNALQPLLSKMGK